MSDLHVDLRIQTEQLENGQIHGRLDEGNDETCKNIVDQIARKIAHVRSGATEQGEDDDGSSELNYLGINQELNFHL